MDGGILRYMVFIDGGGIGFECQVNVDIKLELILSRNDMAVAGLLVRERSPKSSGRVSSSSLVTEGTLISEDGLVGIMLVARKRYITRGSLKYTLKCISEESYLIMREIE